jgi:hypothetical protein
MEAVAHRLVLLIVDLQEQHIWVLLRNLADLHGAIIFSEQNILFDSPHIARGIKFTVSSTSVRFTPWGEEHGNRHSRARRNPRLRADRRR